MPEVSIPVGKGSVLVKKNISREAAKGRCVVLRSTSRSGPCKDDMCQIIRGVMISIELLQEEDDNLSIFAGDGIFLAIEKSIASSIDKGRQSVTVGIGLSGKPFIKGLNYAD